jgi:crossover junction endodeoxyribonuclease RusA
MINLTLPYPPSVNHYKSIGRLTRTKTGKLYQARVNSPETKRFFYEVWMKCRAEGVKSLLDSTIALEVDVHPSDARKRDLDNILKVLIDSLVKAGCFNDDSQIALLTVKRCSIIEGGQIICRIAEHVA